MTTHDIARCLTVLGWSVRELGRQLDVSPQQARLWATGERSMPPRAALWLRLLARFHRDHPPPPR